MALDCPRCSQPMRIRKIHPKGAQRPIEIDECASCGGLWLDKGEAAVICPTVAYLERRHIEIVSLGTARGGISCCPRCGKTPYEFTILDLHVDYCEGCGGVWLDADDHTGRTRGLDGEQVDLPRGSPYRAIQRAVRTSHAKCIGCSAETRIRDMYMACDGLACRRCYFAATQRQADRRAQESRDHPLVEALIGDLFALSKEELDRGTAGERGGWD